MNQRSGSSNLKPMDLKASPQMQDWDHPLESSRNPLAGNLSDAICKLQTRETSDFLKAFSVTARAMSEESRGLFDASIKGRRDGICTMAQRGLETPSTPGRPLFSFSPGHLPRKNIPSKWDDAEKWLIGSPCHESPAHLKKSSKESKIYRPNEDARNNDEASAAKNLRVSQEKCPSSPDLGFDGATSISLGAPVAFNGASADVLLKDKFTDNVESLYPNLRYLEPSKESFLFKSSFFEPSKDSTAAAVAEVQHRDVGTEMTPLGSSTTTTRCHTPIKIASPARHNTPADRSGPLVPYNTGIDISELKDCHLAKLELSAQYDSLAANWSSREEEEEEVSKSLRHLEESGGRKNVAESRASSAWEEEEKTKSCIRYQREEAKVQAWINLQNAKAEAQSRKLETNSSARHLQVKIQKMRSKLEEKLMKRMTIVNRRAEELRAAALLQHSQQLQSVSEQAHKMKSQRSSHFTGEGSCGCFPCNYHL